MVPITAYAVTPTDTPSWEILKALTWPGAFAVAVFSPPAKAIANWLDGRKTNLAAWTSADQASAIREIAQLLHTTAELQSQQGQLLQKLQEGMTVLLDRTR